MLWSRRRRSARRSRGAIITTAQQYRVAPAEDVSVREIDGLTLLYHRPSGLTHIVTSPVPEMLAAMADGAALDADALLARLAGDFDIVEGGADAVAARLAELAELGLVVA